MAGETFRYEKGSMEESISELKSKKSTSDSLSDDIKNVVIQELMAEGITGAVAEALAETFDAEVVKPMTSASESSAAYISANESVRDLANETIENNLKIAG